MRSEDEGTPAEGRWGRGEQHFRWLAAVALGVAGLLINLLAVRLSPGTDLIFGGVAYLLAAVTLGPVPGLVAAGIASVRTLWLWNHPYAWLIFSAEALVVGWVVSRRRYRPLVADLIYWLVGGIPLLFLTYHLLLGISGNTAALLFLKQPLNGLIDALLVETLLLFPAVRRVLRVPSAPRLHFTLAAVVALAAVLPTLGFGVWVGRQEWNRSVQRSEERVHLLADAYASRLEQYVMLHERAVRSVSEAVARRGEWNPDQLQRLVSVEQEQFAGFLNMYAADSRAVTVAFAPQFDAGGESLIGLDFSDRSYFQTLRRTRQTVISDVFAGRGGADAPILVIAHPVILRDTLAGYVLGALNLRTLPSPGKGLERERLRVADRAGALLLDTGRRGLNAPAQRPASDPRAFAAVRQAEQGGIVTYTARDAQAIAAATAARQLAGVARVPSLGWWVWVEQPFTRIQAVVVASYVRLFVLLIGVILLALLVSGILARYLAYPLLRLRTAAGALGAGNLEARVGPLGAAEPVEIQELGRGFDEMAETLAQRDRDLRQLTEAAQSASRAKTDFIATMSHELRTPLNAMLGHLELLEMGIHGELAQAQRTALERIQVATRHLRGLIEEVLSFSRLESGHAELNVRETDLCELLREVGTVVEPLAHEKGLRFRVDCATEDPLRIATDPDKVRQILINLAGNAVKFTERGEIRVRLRRQGEHALLTVRDTGIGISQQDRARLFQPFQQLASGLARPHGGTGLGLYLSGQYARLLGGRIEVDSTLGEGSEFSLLLPVQAGREQGSGNRERQKEGAASE